MKDCLFKVLVGFRRESVCCTLYLYSVVNENGLGRLTRCKTGAPVCKDCMMHPPCALVGWFCGKT